MEDVSTRRAKRNQRRQSPALESEWNRPLHRAPPADLVASTERESDTDQSDAKAVWHNALVNSSTPGLYYIRIEANPPEGAPTRHGPVLSLSFQLIHTATSTTTRTALLSYDPRGPGTGWWSGRAGPESQITLTIDHAAETDGRLSLSGHISGRLISRSDDGATTAPVEARFSIEAEIGD